jgi:prolyl-tRNA synthetase
MMQDRKALQAGTSHYLGQNFAKSSGIKFSNKEGKVQFAYTTSWGVTTRMIGAMIMCHGDDDGLRLPPKIAHRQVVIIPVIPKPELEKDILNYAEEIAKTLRQVTYNGRPISVHVDKRDRRGGEKTWEWIKKGVPARIEVGPRDLEARAMVLARRDQDHKNKTTVKFDDLSGTIAPLLDEIQNGYYNSAKAFRDQHICRDITNFEELKKYFTPKSADKPEIHGGFVLAKWCGDKETEAMLDDLKISIRCLPSEQSGTQGTCILTGKPATIDAIFAKSY